MDRIIIFFLVITYLIPAFDAVDRIGNHWIYLNIVSIIAATFYLIKSNNNSLSIIISKFWSNNIFKAYTFFLIWSLISFFWSTNLNESIVVFSQIFSIYVLLIVLLVSKSYYKNYTSYILYLLLFLFIVELYFVLRPIITDLLNDNLSFRSNRYVGLLSNVNITSFSLLYKTPIVFYFINKTKKTFYKISLYVLIFLMVQALFVLGSRASLISLGVILTFLIFKEFILNRQTSLKNKSLGSTSVIFFIILILNIGFNKLYNLKDEKLNVLNRASSIVNTKTDGSIRERLSFYNISLEIFKKNPINGIGIGNWKTESIPYHKEKIYQYVVPYHSHNDFLQILSELGIIGFVLFISFFFFFIKETVKNIYHESYPYILLFVLVYLIDSLLNFPFARTTSQVQLILFLTLIFNNGEFKIKR